MSTVLFYSGCNRIIDEAVMVVPVGGCVLVNSIG